MGVKGLKHYFADAAFTRILCLYDRREKHAPPNMAPKPVLIILEPVLIILEPVLIILKPVHRHCLLSLRNPFSPYNG